METFLLFCFSVLSVFLLLFLNVTIFLLSLEQTQNRVWPWLNTQQSLKNEKSEFSLLINR